MRSTAVILIIALNALGGDINRPWRRHTIDNSSRGADGTRLADANGDGLLDIVTGFEQGGITRAYLNPGPKKVKNNWPAVTTGKAESVEDAVFIDIDGDGLLDVISSCEGKREAILVHWAPKDYLNAKQWITEELPGGRDKMRWMFATPMDVNGDGQMDLLAGGKGTGSELGWWEIPKTNPRNLASWKWHKLRNMGWLMSLETADMDGDGDLDILYTDRKGKIPGAFWMENGAKWKEHLVGVKGREAMFLTRGDVDQDGLEDIVIATRPREMIICRRLDQNGERWKEFSIPLPTRAGDAKAPAVADFDHDGRMDIVFTTERAKDKEGVCRLVYEGKNPFGKWTMKPVSGIDGVKHDLIELLDLDADGDLDIITCEEVRNFGVIWYENPFK
ncbi:MAG: FG-GAP repeat domain-containing protein [Limisphaerales bacterium]